MNDSHEQADVPSPPPETAAAPPPTPSAPSHSAAGYAASPAGTGRARGLQPKSPVLACVLSLMPGVGQLYVGYYKLGFVHNIVFSSTIAMLAGVGERNPIFPVMVIFLAFFYIYNIVDAGRRAVFYGVAGVELPSMNVSVPSFGGSIGGGIALIGLGFILLLNTRFGISLDWIEEWWPVAPMLMGTYLLVKAIQDRGADAPSASSTAADSPTYESEPDSSSLL